MTESRPLADATAAVPDAVVDHAAHRLALDGIWVRRDFAVDEDGIEVDADHPARVASDYVFEVDHRRIVVLVLGYLTEAGYTPASSAGQTAECRS